MHVVLIHDAIIPPKTYGGTERVIHWLCRALNKLGHRTTLLARQGSQIPDTHCLVLKSDHPVKDQIPEDADVLHFWATPAKLPSKPFLVTIEGNGSPGERFHENTLFISKSHARNHGGTHFVYNGVDPTDFHASSKREDYLVFLAKASWKVKNLKGAIAVARAAGMRLEVLGNRSWPLNAHLLFPRVHGVRYHGMVTDTIKRELLSKAKALIFPVRWHEPFGIAPLEALASGCPVLGTPYGALPEIVSPETGYLSHDGRELASAARLAHRFSPEECRNRVLLHFTHVQMARRYLAYYDSVIKHGTLEPLGTPTPKTRASVPASTLLPWVSP